ncbi:hypothetical protein [Synechococcus phage BUCT-ZZ01]|nr:hypothetical protein [Synechococcus phage BUCT-ZZ01]
MKIDTTIRYFNEDTIKKIEEIKDAVFVCESQIKQANGWSDSPVAIFYGKDTHPVSKSRYFGIFFRGETPYICDGQSAVDEDFVGIVDNDVVYFSSARHHFNPTPNGFAIDGGRDYFRILGNETGFPKMVKLYIEDGVVKIREEEE